MMAHIKKYPPLPWIVVQSCRKMCSVWVIAVMRKVNVTIGLISYLLNIINTILGKKFLNLKTFFPSTLDSRSRIRPRVDHLLTKTILEEQMCLMKKNQYNKLLFTYSYIHFSLSCSLLAMSMIRFSLTQLGASRQFPKRRTHFPTHDCTMLVQHIIHCLTGSLCWQLWHLWSWWQLDPSGILLHYTYRYQRRNR